MSVARYATGPRTMAAISRRLFALSSNVVKDARRLWALRPRKHLAACCLVFAAAGAAPALADDVVTIYSADGLHDGAPNWYQTQFDAFTKATGIKVQYIEGGSGVVVERIAKEASNPQADVLVTLPPFIQKAAADGDLQPYRPHGDEHVRADQKDDAGRYIAIVNNYANFIYNAAVLKEQPRTFTDLLDQKFKGKIQYSTPGQAGDGTAVMIEVFHAFGSKDAGFDFLKKLQANNVGPSASTGKLAALVNKGELSVANGDMQMNASQMVQDPNLRIFWPAGPDGKRSTVPLPYYAGLVQGAPHADAGKKLLDFLLSKEAQSTVSSLAQGLPVRTDVVPTDTAYKNFHKMLSGVTVWMPVWPQVLKDLSSDVARWHDVTGS